MGRRIGGRGGGSDPAGKGAPAAAALLLGCLMFAAGGGGATVGGAVSGSADAVSARELTSKKSESKKAARSGRPAEAWRRMGLKQLRRRTERSLECAAHSFGEVRAHFLRRPCRSLERTLFGVADSDGNTAVISVVRVTARSRSRAIDFKRLIDEHGTGDVRPLATSALGLGGVEVTGYHYGSRRSGSSVVTAEAENLSGNVGGELLDAAAEVATYLPRS